MKLKKNICNTYCVAATFSISCKVIIHTFKYDLFWLITMFLSTIIFMIPLFLLMWFGKGLVYILSEFTYPLKAINPFLISRLTYFLNVLHVLILWPITLNCKQISHPIYTNIGKMNEWACKKYKGLTLVWSFIDIVFLKTWKCEACTLAMGCVLGILSVKRLGILIINMLLVMVKRLSIRCLAILGYDLWLVLWGLWNFVKYACHNYNWDVWWYKVGRIIWRIWLEILRIGRIGSF